MTKLDNIKYDPIPFYEDKRVVVTGASGLIGTYVMEHLRSWRVGGVLAFQHKRDFQRLPQSIQVLDLRDWSLADPRRGDLSEMFAGSDVALSCAGITGGIGITRVDPLSYVGPATVIALNTLHATALAGVKHFGYLSSTTVYPASDGPLCEGDTADGDPYPLYAGIGHSKRFVEQVCRYYSEKTEMRCAAIRPSGAYGRYDNFDERTSHVLPAMVARAMKKPEKFEIWGDGDDVRDFVHAKDIAYGLLLAVAHQGDAKFTVHNIASGRGVTTRQLAEIVVESVEGAAWGHPQYKPEIVCEPTKPTALKTRLVDISKAQRDLGYEPKIPLHVGIEDVVEHLRAMR